MTRGRNGPRQPGGGKQISGPRHRSGGGRAGARAGKPKAGPQRDNREAAGKSHPHPGVRAKQAAKGNRAGTSSVEHRFRRSAQEEGVKAARPPRAPQQEMKPAPVLPTAVQTVTVTPDEDNMRVDRFFEARFPGLSFSHIQRVIRKGEVRVDGRRTQPKARLAAGQAVRVPPLRLDAPPSSAETPAAQKDRDFLKSIILYEDDDVMVLNKPMGLAVQGGSGTTRHVDGMLEALRGPGRDAQRPRLVHRLDKDTAGCLLVAKTRFAAAALAKTFRSRAARKIYWALVAGVPKPRQGRISTYLAKEEREEDSVHAHRRAW